MELSKDLWIKYVLLESRDLYASQKVVELGIKGLANSKQTEVAHQK